jgi:hypothetical protein
MGEIYGENQDVTTIVFLFWLQLKFCPKKKNKRRKWKSLVSQWVIFFLILIKGLRLVWRFMILSLNDHYLENQLVVCMMIFSKRRNKNQLPLVMCDSQRINLIYVISFLNISIYIHENKTKMWKGVCIKKKIKWLCLILLRFFLSMTG